MILASSAGAAPITFTFRGDFQGNITDSADGAISDLFQIGDEISGFYTFESTAAESSPGSGIYLGAVTALSFQVDRSGYAGSSPSATIFVTPIPNNNFYRVDSRDFEGLTGPDVGENSLLFFNLSVNGDFLSDTSLLLLPPPVTPDDNGGANSDRVELIYQNAAGDISGVAFRLLEVNVPEPGTSALLLTSGLLALLIGNGGRRAA